MNTLTILCMLAACVAVSRAFSLRGSSNGDDDDEDKPRRCSDAAVAHGAIVYSGGSTAPHRSGTTATVTCDVGYYISGSPTMTCKRRRWSTAPTCLPNPCGDALSVTDGTVAYSGGSTATHASGTTATVTCDEGHIISGSPTITCTAGSWSTPPTCTPDGGTTAATTTTTTTSGTCKDVYIWYADGSVDCKYLTTVSHWGMHNDPAYWCNEYSLTDCCATCKALRDAGTIP